MNTAYILAIIWGALAVLALLFVEGAHVKVAQSLILASALSALLGVAIQYGMLGG